MLCIVITSDRLFPCINDVLALVLVRSKTSLLVCNLIQILMVSLISFAKNINLWDTVSAASNVTLLPM